MSQTGLAIAECRWWDSGNVSVRPLFETLAGIVEGNPHDVRYDMFAEAASLRAIIYEITQFGLYHSLYIASHGSDGAVSGLGDASISRVVLRNIIIDANRHGNLCGVYFGSCLIGNPSNAAFWLGSSSTTNLQWIAGYSTSVDWVDSSAIDMIFWSKYLSERRTNRGRRRNKKTELQMVKHAATEMKTLMPNVFSVMGFNVYHLDTGGTLTPVW